jgi:hypothetical protein
VISDQYSVERQRQTSNVVRHILTFHALRFTDVDDAIDLTVETAAQATPKLFSKQYSVSGGRQ